MKDIMVLRRLLKLFWVWIGWPFSDHGLKFGQNANFEGVTKNEEKKIEIFQKLKIAGNSSRLKKNSTVYKKVEPLKN